MAALTIRLKSSNDGNFASMTESDQTAASRTDGWTVAKTAAGNSSEYAAGTKQASGSFSSQTTTPKPASFVTGAGANAIKSDVPYNGTFDVGSWTFTFAVRAGTASSQAGRVRLRVFAAQADGSSSRELTGSTQVGTTSAALSTTADVTTVVTWSPGTTITLNNEYLFLVIAWEITTASGSNSGDVLPRTGTSTTGSRLATPNFTPVPASAPRLLWLKPVGNVANKRAAFY